MAVMPVVLIIVTEINFLQCLKYEGPTPVVNKLPIVVIFGEYQFHTLKMMSY